MIVFASDHGEGLGEHHESTHSLLLHDATLHVPLIIKPPAAQAGVAESAGRRMARRVGLVDVLPTILDLLAIETPEDVQGRSLAADLVAGAEPARDPRRALYSETLAPRFHATGGSCAR